MIGCCRQIVAAAAAAAVVVSLHVLVQLSRCAELLIVATGAKQPDLVGGH